MRKNFEKELPEGYGQVYRIDATEKKTGIIFNLAALIIMLGVFIIGMIPAFIRGFDLSTTEPHLALIALAVFFASMILYIILHELVHGVAYKALTKQKLTFGLALSCAFCGVPTIYTYRRCALIALLSPFVTFSVLFVALSVWMFFLGSLFYMLSLLLLSMHIGGCVGDLYMSWLFVTRFKSPDTLIRDTGPEQTVYVKTPAD